MANDDHGIHRDETRNSKSIISGEGRSASRPGEEAESNGECIDDTQRNTCMDDLISQYIAHHGSVFSGMRSLKDSRRGNKRNKSVMLVS